MLKQTLFLLFISVLVTGNTIWGQDCGSQDQSCCSSGCSSTVEQAHNNRKEKIEMNFEAKQISRGYRQTINATPEVIFPLLCPARESEWLDDWDYKMVYSKSGIAEVGAVFTTSFGEDSEQIWIITKHDPIKNEVQFARVVAGLVASIIDIHVLPKDDNGSYVDITYTYTGLTEKGNNFIDTYTEEFFTKNMKEWEDSMNYFLKTGSILKLPH